MPIKMDLKVEGLKEMQKLLRDREWYATPWREELTRLAEKAGLAARNRAPYRTGRLRKSIKGAVQRRPFPAWAVVRVNARRNSRGRRFAYPRALEFVPKLGHWHWLINSVWTVWRNAEASLNRIGDAMERNWERGGR